MDEGVYTLREECGYAKQQENINDDRRSRKRKKELTP
jgi:hypothetical protein